jgi:hypothetical protein
MVKRAIHGVQAPDILTRTSSRSTRTAHRVLRLRTTTMRYAHELNDLDDNAINYVNF